AEDVVDEYENIRVLDVAEILGDRESRKSDSESRTRWLVHLTVDERAGIDDSGFLHLEVKVVSFARALADAAEDGLSTVTLCDVVDQLLDDDRLADAGASEESDLSALHEWGDQIDDLDSGLEDFCL